jgi:hypothetical protein
MLVLQCPKTPKDAAREPKQFLLPPLVLLREINLSDLQAKRVFPRLYFHQ